MPRDFECVDTGFEPNEDVDVVIRPEDVKIVKSEDGMLEGEVESVTFKGVHYEMMVRSKGFRWMVQSTLMEPVGAKVGMKILPNDIHIMKREKVVLG